MLDFLVPIAFGLHVGSAHFHPTDDQNNINTGIYFRSESAQFGGYINTFDDPTIYGAYRLKFDNSPLELLLGGAIGYKKKTTYYHLDGYKIPQETTGAKILPMYALTGAYKITPQLAVRGFVNHSFVNLSLEYSWK